MFDWSRSIYVVSRSKLPNKDAASDVRFGILHSKRIYQKSLYGTGTSFPEIL